MIENIWKKNNNPFKEFSPANVSLYLTFGNAPPRQSGVGEKRVEGNGLGSPSLFPEVERLRESSHSPQRVVSAVVQLCRHTQRTNSIIANESVA